MNKFGIRALLLAVALTGCSAAQSAAPSEVSAADTAEAAAENVAAEEVTAGETGGESAQEADTAAAQETAQETPAPEETVTIVIPTIYESVTTQEEADEICRRNGYESAVLNEDGSLSITMDKDTQEQMLLEFREAADKGIGEIIGSGEDSAIRKIEYSDDFSVFTVTIEGDGLGIIEKQAAEELVMYGTLYHIYSGNDVEHIQVDYISEESGELIESADSGSLSEAY